MVWHILVEDAEKWDMTHGYFEQAEHLKELYEINTSSEERQGRRMTEHYLEEVTEEEKKEYIKWYGVFNKENLLLGYIKLIATPKFYNMTGILGHSEYLKDNIMHLMLHDLMIELIKENENNESDVYIMYDTYFGASEGIKLYKKKHCFTPYKVKWKYIAPKGEKKCEKDYTMTT